MTGHRPFSARANGRSRSMGPGASAFAPRTVMHGTSRSSTIMRGHGIMKAIHPGRILRRELESRKMSANALALALRTPSGRIVDILNGKRGISPETALQLARFFGASAMFWLNLQTAYELAVAEQALGERIAEEVKPAAA